MVATRSAKTINASSSTPSRIPNKDSTTNGATSNTVSPTFDTNTTVSSAAVEPLPKLDFQKHPVQLKHRKTLSFATLDKHSLPFHSQTSNLHIHQRLMRLIPKSPGIALFPWLIDMRSKKGTSRKKKGDKLFTKSISTFLSWPLDQRRVRLGLVASYSGNGETRVSHVWVIGVVKHKDPRKGVLVFIYDDAGTEAHETMRSRDSSMAIPYLLTAQQTLFYQLKQQRFKIQALFFGGRPYTGGIEQCLENASLICERFVDSMAEEDDFKLQMIRAEGLEQMSLHSRKVEQVPSARDKGSDAVTDPHWDEDENEDDYEDDGDENQDPNWKDDDE